MFSPCVNFFLRIEMFSPNNNCFVHVLHILSNIVFVCILKNRICGEKIVAWRKHFICGRNIWYMERACIMREIFIAWRNYLICFGCVFLNINVEYVVESFKIPG